MSELEQAVRGYTIKVKNFKRFVELCCNGRPLVAIQIPRGSREKEIFVAYFVKGLKEVNDGSYKPESDSNIYNACLTYVASNQRWTVKKGDDWVLPPMNYPIVIDREMFYEGKVLTLDPNSHLGTYIQRYFREGRPTDTNPLPELSLNSRLRIIVKDSIYRGIHIVDKYLNK